MAPALRQDCPCGTGRPYDACCGRLHRGADLSFHPALTWTRLEVLVVEAGGADDDHGVVEFRAHHHTPAGAGVLHERSTFGRRGGRWVYVAAE